MPSLPPLDPEHALGLASASLPRHIAIIMDGNGRWARARGQERLRGHYEGVKSVKEIVTTCARLGVECLTLYSFSLENWKRPADEVNGLMELCAAQLAAERDTFLDNGIRLRHVGRRAQLPAHVADALAETEAATAGLERMTLCLALNYGGRGELVDAMQSLAQRVAAGTLRPEEIDEQAIAGALYTADLPDPDLLIRTAGELRVSNFLLWQISYAEIYVTDTLWPEFRAPQLFAALRAYADRERRFGSVAPAGA